MSISGINMIIPQLLLLLEMLVPVWIHVPEISRQTPASRFHPAAQHLPAANRHQLFAAGRLRVRSRRFNCSPFVWSAPKTRDTYGPPFWWSPQHRSLGECVRVKPWDPQHDVDEFDSVRQAKKPRFPAGKVWRQSWRPRLN